MVTIIKAINSPVRDALSSVELSYTPFAPLLTGSYPFHQNVIILRKHTKH